MELMAAGDSKSLERFTLWIDAVGGYLVCSSSEVVFGQATSASPADVAIVADIAPKHFRIIRTQEVYLIEPLAEICLEGRPIREKTPLIHGQLIGLTGGVELRFRKPHPLSMTATLEIETRQRTRPWSDGILLMADSCLVGPSANDHVLCKHWGTELVFFRRGNELHVRCGCPFSVDGESRSGTSLLTLDSRLIGENFSLSLESVPISRNSAQD
jgi:hypothetical protein